MKLKKWAEKLLIYVNLLMILLLASECSNTMLFIISKIFEIVVIIVNSLILNKYSDVFKEEI